MVVALSDETGSFAVLKHLWLLVDLSWRKLLPPHLVLLVAVQVTACGVTHVLHFHHTICTYNIVFIDFVCPTHVVEAFRDFRLESGWHIS